MSTNNLEGGDCPSCGPDVYFCAKDCNGEDHWVKLTFHEEINVLTKAINVMTPLIRNNSLSRAQNDECIDTLAEWIGVGISSGGNELCPLEPLGSGEQTITERLAALEGAALGAPTTESVSGGGFAIVGHSVTANVATGKTLAQATTITGKVKTLLSTTGIECISELDFSFSKNGGVWAGRACGAVFPYKIYVYPAGIYAGEDGGTGEEVVEVVMPTHASLGNMIMTVTISDNDIEFTTASSVVIFGAALKTSIVATIT